MKIEWLDIACTQARVTRGRLWWRRSARVEWRDGKPDYEHQTKELWPGRGWFYSYTNEKCEETIASKLYDAENAEADRRARERKDAAWTKDAAIPVARVMERKS